MGGPEALAPVDEIGRQSAVANALVRALGGVVLTVASVAELKARLSEVLKERRSA